MNDFTFSFTVWMCIVCKVLRGVLQHSLIIIPLINRVTSSLEKFVGAGARVGCVYVREGVALPLLTMGGRHVRTADMCVCPSPSVSFTIVINVSIHCNFIKTIPRYFHQGIIIIPHILLTRPEKCVYIKHS